MKFIEFESSNGAVLINLNNILTVKANSNSREPSTVITMIGDHKVYIELDYITVERAIISSLN